MLEYKEKNLGKKCQQRRNEGKMVFRCIRRRELILKNLLGGKQESERERRFWVFRI